jgi:hypothetical protein
MEGIVMNRQKRVLLLTLVILVLTLTTLACGETDSPAQETPSDETPAQEITATPRLTSTPAPTVDISDCTLGATFQADVTIPDNTRIEAGQSFVKTWRIRNTGTCDWGMGYRFAFVDGEEMSGPDAVEVPETPVGESTEISVELIAPMEEGQHRGHWQVCVNETECFGEKVYVQIISYPPPEPTSTPISISTGGIDGFVDCLVCARQHPWLAQLRSEPGLSAGVVVGGLRHVDEINILDAHWHDEEGQWWYQVEGLDQYTKDVGETVTGWLPETSVTVGIPEQYPLGAAWVEFAIGIQTDVGGDVTIWNRSKYYNGQGQGIGFMWHGTPVQISDSEWDSENGIWFYEITGVDSKTKETITGWLDGIFLVLAPPP